MMKSPFPGMDPYLEPHWLDVHTKLVAYAADALNEQLPEDLIASAEERIAVEADLPEAPNVAFGPDVRVFELPWDSPAVTSTSAEGGVVTAPLRLVVADDPITERFIRIVEAGNEKVITVIEFVSPTNKRGRGLRAFRRKRRRLLAEGVNVVEIDLVRAGDWERLLLPHRCPKHSLTPYRVTVRVPSDPDAVYLHPISIRSPLPKIQIPLRKNDVAVEIDLQPLLNQLYERGRYSRRLNYRKPLTPPLDEADEKWVAQLLKESGR